MMMTVPEVSLPLRPALPAICVYSPGVNDRNAIPSCFRVAAKTTVLAGILTPMAKVSVAKRTRMREREKRISTASFKIGSKPEW